jgi:lysophospholipase L1-like esterase
MMINSVCIFGDSISKGVIFDETKNKYCFLKESFAFLLEKCQPIKISNFARFGCTISKGSDIIKNHLQELGKFDYTVLEFGGNDCDFDWAEVADSPEEKHLCKTPLLQFRDQYISLIELVLENGSKPILLTLPPIDPKRYFKWVSRGLNANNILAFLGDVQNIFSWQSSYSTVISELAETYKIPLIDIRYAFLEEKNFSEYLCDDGIHPNSKGHLLISKTIEKKLAVL